VTPTHKPSGTRRFLASAVLLLGRVAALGAGLLLLLWLVGRVANDRWLWSQYLFWLPTIGIVLGSWVLLGASWLGAWVSRRLSRKPRRRISRVWIGLAAVTGAVAIWMLAFEWRSHRYLSRSSAAEGDLAIAYWNPATPIPGFAERLGRVEADVYAIANQPSHRDVDEFRDLLSADGASWTRVRAGRMACVSRYPIRRWALMRMGLDGKVWFGDRLEIGNEEVVRTDEGRALFVEIDFSVGPAGEPLVVWIVDLPSDPLLHRETMLREARAVIERWRGSVLAADAEGGRRVVDREGSFPAPHVIIGDFNTPRGSRSLRGLVGDMRGGFEQAGRGLCGTAPRPLPLWHIDQIFTAAPARVVDYDTFDPGVSLHMGQRAVIAGSE